MTNRCDHDMVRCGEFLYCVREGCDHSAPVLGLPSESARRLGGPVALPAPRPTQAEKAGHARVAFTAAALLFVGWVGVVTALNVAVGWLQSAERSELPPRLGIGMQPSDLGHALEADGVNQRDLRHVVTAAQCPQDCVDGQHAHADRERLVVRTHCAHR